MDGLLKEAQTSKSASAKPSKTRTSSERESSPRPSGDVQPGTTTKTTITGAARLPSATRTGQTKTTSELGLAELNHKVDQLTSLLSNVAPVVQKLKAAYDAAQEEEDEVLNSSEGEGEENAAADQPMEPPAKKGKSNDLNASSCVQIAELVKEVTEDEQTEPPLYEKVSSLVDSLLASGLNEPALLKRKEHIKRPEDCKLQTNKGQLRNLGYCPKNHPKHGCPLTKSARVTC